MLKKHGHNLNLKHVAGRHWFSKLSEHLLFKTNKCHFISQMTCILEWSRKGPLIISVYGIMSTQGFRLLRSVLHGQRQPQLSTAPRALGLNGVIFHTPPRTQQTSENVWRQSELSQLGGEGRVLALWIEPRDATQHLPMYGIIHPQQRITQPQISDVERDLEKRENKPFCFLQIGTILYLSGCCLSRESQSSVSGKQEFLMGLFPAGFFPFILQHKLGSMTAAWGLSQALSLWVQISGPCLVTIPMKATKTCPLLETHRDFWKQGQWTFEMRPWGIKLWSKRMFCSHLPFHTFHVLMSASLALWTHHDCITFCYRKLDFWVLTIQEND